MNHRPARHLTQPRAEQPDIRDNSWKDRRFTRLAALAVLVQASAEIFGDSLSDRLHARNFYLACNP